MEWDIHKIQKPYLKEFLKTPYYSFVLLCYNNWNLTKQAATTLIESINHSHKEKGMELIIVNNGSSDETKAGIEQMKESYSHEIEIVPVHLKENMGYTVGSNMGFAQCRGQIITMLNNDLVFPDNWFDGIIDTLESDRSIGVAAPFLSYGSGPEHLGVGFQSLEEMREFAKKFMEENKTRLIYTERVIGACITFRRKLLYLIGGNDFWFGLGLYDDDDWSIRAGIIGYKLVITGASFVHHIGSVTFHQQSYTFSSAFRANDLKFSKKWNKNGLTPANRKHLIEHTPYSREEYYFPLKITDFNTPPSLNATDQTTKKREVLLVADWLYDNSQWRTKLIDIKSKLLPDEETHLYLWIPKTYFPEAEIIQEVKKILDIDVPYVHCIFDEVFPIDLLTFLSKYDVFAAVEGDYVNLYIKSLVEHLSIEIY